MPAPTYAQFLEKIRQKMVDQGFTKKEYETDPITGEIVLDAAGNPNIIDTGVITDDMNKMLLAISQGISEVWTDWQAAQTVSGTAVGAMAGGPGVPVSGTLP